VRVAMNRFSWIALEVLFAAAVLRSVLVAPSWALLAWVPLVLLVVLGHLYIVGGFTLDRHGLPVTGRDADRYAKYRAGLCEHERDHLDNYVTRMHPDH